MASLKQYYSLTITTLLLLAFPLLSTVSPTKPIIYTTSKDQVACAMCDSCDNPCQPVYPPPPPPPPEILCPPPPPPPSPPPPKPECPPPPAPPTCSDCTPCNDCSPPAIIGPYPHPSPQPGVIGGAVYSPPSAVYSPPYGVNPYFPYTPYKTPPSPWGQSAGFRVSFAVPLLAFGLAALCFF